VSPFEPLREQLVEALKATGISRAIGGFDITMNEHQTESFDPHWQPHAWIFVPRREIRRREKTFREYFPKTKPAVRRPVMIKRFNRNLAGIAYAMKGDFSRRVSLPRQRRRNGKTKKRRNVRYRPLRAAQKVELMLMLDQIGLESRVFLYGVEMIDKPNGQRIKAARYEGHD
jgi:hypothetical protein